MRRRAGPLVLFLEGNSGCVRESRLLVHEDEGVHGRPIRSRILVATVQRLDPANPEKMSINPIFGSIERGESAAVPFVAALLAVPLVSHPRRDVCPGYPRDAASLLGHHRSYYRGQFLDFFGRPSAYCGVMLVA